MAQPNIQQTRPRPMQQQQQQAQQRPPQQQQQQRAPPQQQAPAERPRISAVQIEGLVLLKIIKHCGEYLPQRQAVNGKLLGLPADATTVEVTNCFPVPTQFIESDEANENEKKRANMKANKYEQSMIQLMHGVREDNAMVGFYRSALNGAFLTAQTIDAQYRHQLHSASSVCIIYDPTASTKGRLVVRAFRLTDSFMSFYKGQDFGVSSVANHNLSAEDIFEELDVKIHNSHLVHAFLYEIAQLPQHKSLTNGYDRLNQQHHDGLISNLKQLSTTIDAYADQTQQFRSYYSKSSKVRNAREQYLAKWREQNQALRSRGQKPRPLPDLDRMFPGETEPDRIESVTLTAQMNEYCEEVETSIMQGLVKLWVTQGIQSERLIQ